MTYYHVISGLKKPETLIEFEGQGRVARLFNYFISNSNDGKFLKYTTPVGIAQEDMRESDLEKLDYLDAVIGIPIFSERFVETLGSLLAQEAEFHPAEIICKRKTKTFYLTRIIRFEEWIDRDKSDYVTLDDGVKILSSTNVVTKNVQSEFYLARDTVHTNWVASEKLKRLAEQYKMNMVFYEHKPMKSWCAE